MKKDIKKMLVVLKLLAKKKKKKRFTGSIHSVKNVNTLIIIRIFLFNAIVIFKFLVRKRLHFQHKKNRFEKATFLA
jgi:hypothetical protein